MYTNTDLKMMYGPANLDTLSACDDAYADLILLLNKIGKTLLEANDASSAEQFLFMQSLSALTLPPATRCLQPSMRTDTTKINSMN